MLYICVFILYFVFCNYLINKGHINYKLMFEDSAINNVNK